MLPWKAAIIKSFNVFIRWLLGILSNSGRIDNPNLMIQLYSKLIEDLTWKKYFSETYQIVALTTLVHEMQGTLKSNTISLTTKDEEQATAYPKKDLTQSMCGYL